jgi:hypothetical protein
VIARTGRRVAFGLAILFLSLQLVRPELTHPPPPADLPTPPDVKQILRTSCYPCHSNEKRLSWFDQVVPAYWLVTRDVKNARMHLNFSQLGAQPKARQRGVLFESVNQIQMGAMPLPSYVRLHPEAVVTSAQLAVLRNYLLPATSATPPSQPNADAADAQYRQWIAAAGKLVAVHPAPNGIAIPAGYQDWKAISSTDRVDNQTLRVILGNDVAIKAIAANNINPWPDGTTFAKVAWLRQPNESGVVRTGAFLQVEFMIKDSAKYASTVGWGFARWLGTELKPYGTVPGFSSECVGCHAPLQKNDYVFTTPIQTVRSSR